MECKNCGGPVILGFNKYYCKKECDLKEVVNNYKYVTIYNNFNEPMLNYWTDGVYEVVGYLHNKPNDYIEGWNSNIIVVKPPSDKSEWRISGWGTAHWNRSWWSGNMECEIIKEISYPYTELKK